MNYIKGFVFLPALLVVLGIAVLGGIGYVALNPEVLHVPTDEVQDDGVQTAPGDHPEVDHEDSEGMSASAKSSIAWRFASAGEVDHVPYTEVTAVINGTAYPMGKFEGSCAEVGASGGVDGKGLVAGELSAAQCWFAGAGDEIGVFAHEDGGFDLMVGEIEEPIEGSQDFRGNFKVKTSISL